MKITKLIIFITATFLLNSVAYAETKLNQISFISENSGKEQLYLINEDGTGLINISNPNFDYSDIEDEMHWSPDGQKIAFQKKEMSVYNLYIMNVNNKKVAKIPSQSEYTINLDWNPDSNILAFSANKKNDTRNIYLVNSDGTNIKKLKSDGSYRSNPKWSPDGSKLAFISSLTKNEINYQPIIVIGKNGQHIAKLFAKKEDSMSSAHVWSPDSKKIAFESNGTGDFEIYIADIEARKLTNITNSNGFDGYPIFSPNGKKIVFSSARNNIKNKQGSTLSQLFVMDLETFNVINISHNIQDPSNHLWSPKGDKILFSSMPDLFDFYIHVVNSNGSNLSKPFSGLKGYWSKDGQKIMFSAHVEDKFQIFIMNSDGTKIKKVYNNGILPLWRPNTK